MRSAIVSMLVAGCSLVAGGWSWSQEVIELDPRYYCAAEPGGALDSVALFPPTRAARQTLESIIERIGLSPDGLTLREMDARGSRAFIHPESGERMILYNEGFLEALDEGSDSRWVNHAILAHELGHHISFHFDDADPNERARKELAADRFAGRSLALMGASLDATERVFRELRAGSDGYPSSRARVTAARNGWLSAEPGGPVVGPGIVNPVVDPVRAPRVSNLAVFANHSPSVYHAGGGTPGAGIQFLLRGRLEYEREASVSVTVYLEFQNGGVIYPDVREAYYRSRSSPGVATGSQHIPFRGGELDLANIVVNPIPYYVLNLYPTGLQTTYLMVARASVFVDGVAVATSLPVPLSVRW